MKEKEYSLKGKVALITGGAKRVGKETALTLAAKGCHIALHYNSSRAEALKTARQIEKLGVEVTLFKADVRSSAQVKKGVQTVLKKMKQINILVNNAAVFKRTPFPKVSEKDWDLHLDTNLKGPFLFANEIAPHMLKRKSGKIVNITDWAGARPFKNYLPYTVSKAGLIGMTEALAKTLAPNIQVNAVAPGPVLPPTGMSQKEKNTIIKNTPLKKMGTPQDVAQAILFLIEHSSFITGHTLMVEGGRLIG